MGTKVPRDIAAAARYSRMAAGQGYAHAQKSFAKMLETRQGVPKDLPLVLKYYRRQRHRESTTPETLSSGSRGRSLPNASHVTLVNIL
jgi:hypothetical protein